MPITPLPQFEEDVAQLERERAERIAKTTPDTVVVRFGAMRMIGEFKYAGDVRPGCGSKLVCETHRGTELGELLTSTCPNAGCGSSVTRKEMLEYIDASGGRQYPFHTDGRAIRVATVEDLQRQQELDDSCPELLNRAKQIAKKLNLDMKPVQVELILGGERATVYFASEERVDFREMVNELRPILGTRVEMRQVGARDEARLTADYERCGQYCCCKSFLKVLKPVSMKSAKVQKATLDPLKISGRCGRLMCCLRYEDETYDDLRKRLPHRKSRVGTPEGDGIVVETQILTQLVLVSLDADERRIAVPVEELTEPGLAPKPKPKTDTRDARPARDADSDEGGPTKKKRRRRRRRRSGEDDSDSESRPSGEPADENAGDAKGHEPRADDGAPRKKRRRRRRRRGKGGGDGASGASGGSSGGD
ncbi:MAG: regulatory iron-sulfur-containing complex subunit RicT [Phycisphaerales bacterium]